MRFSGSPREGSSDPGQTYHGHAGVQQFWALFREALGRASAWNPLSSDVRSTKEALVLFTRTPILVARVALAAWLTD